MYCMKCGRELKEGDVFCSGCGTAVQTKSAESSAEGSEERHLASEGGSLSAERPEGETPGGKGGPGPEMYDEDYGGGWIRYVGVMSAIVAFGVGIASVVIGLPLTKIANGVGSMAFLGILVCALGVVIAFLIYAVARVWLDSVEYAARTARNTAAILSELRKKNGTERDA